MIAVRVRFIDLGSGLECVLVIPPDGKVYPAAAADPTIGVAHTRAGSACPRLADLALELDAFFCPLCQYNGRISGWWASNQIAAARSRDGVTP